MKSELGGADVVIAGAGIAGIATAYQLAVKHGVRDVVLVDPLAPLSFTSDKTGANYRDWWPRRVMVEIARRSIVLMREMRNAGAAFEMNRRGYLYVTKESQAVWLDEWTKPYEAAGVGPIRVHRAGDSFDAYEPHESQALEGADVLLDRALIREAFPHLSPDVSAATHVRNAGSVDIVALGQYMLAEAKRRGVRVVRGEVSDIVSRAGRVARVVVKTEEGRRDVATRILVDAAGPFAQRVAELVGISLPLVNVLQQKITIADPQRVVPQDAPFTIFQPQGIHIKADGTAERPMVKIGWAFNKDVSEPMWEPRLSEDFARVVIDGAARVVPGLESYARALPPLVGHDAGYYTSTPDHLPLVGALGVGGMYVVGGLAGYGGMAACAAGEIAAALIAETQSASFAEAFRPDRFADPAYVAAIAGGKQSSGAL